MMWVKNPTWFNGGFIFSDFVAFPLLVQAWALAHTGMASIDVLEKLALLVASKNSSRRVTNGSCSASSLRWVALPAGLMIRRVQRSVVGSFIPTKIVLPLYLMTHFLLSNFTMHPASVSTRIPKREAMDNSGMMCPTRVVGRPGITMSHICVDSTQQPLANVTLRGHVVFCLLRTGVPSITKIWVAPKSAITSFGAILIAAYAFDTRNCDELPESSQRALRELPESSQSSLQ